MNWLDDKTIFNWGRTDETDVADDVFFYLDKSGISGSLSDSDTRPHSRSRSRTNSFSSVNSSTADVFKVEGMTSTLTVPDEKKSRTIARRIFKIDDVEEDDETKLGSLAVSEPADENKKDV
jgi:glycerol-3-phosphate O-acyltransferase/dihydroxyacetone phosphate acyltransferase